VVRISGIANATTELEIDITAEMLEAGMREYASRWRDMFDPPNDDVAREMLSAAFKAMYHLRQSQSKSARGEPLSGNGDSVCPQPV
jgi:hypothetical protein